MTLPLSGARRAAPLIQTPFVERNGEVSPDGRWLAYQANDSGQFEIYVRPFPDVTAGRWQVSTGGGTRPLWHRNGQELFYLAPTGEPWGLAWIVAGGHPHVQLREQGPQDAGQHVRRCRPLPARGSRRPG